MTDRQTRDQAAFDWDGARRRLSRAMAAIEAAEDLSSERARRIMGARREALARTNQDAEAAVRTIEVVVFEIADISFAVESRLVREVLRTPPLTALPKTGSLLEGVGNVHGAAVPVFDIRPLLGLDAATPMARTQLLLLGDGRESLGVLVDSADQLRAIPAGRIRAAEGHGAAEGILRGVTPDGLTVVDGDRLMAADRLWQQPPATPGNPLPVPSETRN